MKMILRNPMILERRSICFGFLNKDSLFDGFSIKTDGNSKLSYIGQLYFSEWREHCRSFVDDPSVLSFVDDPSVLI